MSGAGPSLVESFHRTYRGPRADGPAEPLDAALQRLAAAGRAAWPRVPLEDAAFAAHIGAVAPAEGALTPWLDEVRAGDLFLACACAAGVPEALRAFDAAFLSKLPTYLGVVRATPQIAAETKQALLERLFVGAPGRPPKIRQYGGQGSLEGWVRVSAVRTALNLMGSEKAGAARTDDADALARVFVPERDPELELLRARHERDFVAAFREAIAALSPRDRSVLRFIFVEHLTPARVGAMYGVHRTTAMRWIDAAQEEVLRRTRAGMMERLHLTPSECEGIFAVVRSRLEITLSSLLKSST
jgi:RNA polymerase sigma-70 factor (ECF subfamily)